MKKISIVFVALVLVLTSRMAIAANKNAFTDMSGTEYYAVAAEALADAGILSGYEDGSFRASGSITRAEMAVIVCRMIGEEASSSTRASSIYDDVNTNHWANGYIYSASQQGIINGYPNKLFKPENNVTYEEAVKMIVCALELDDDVEYNASDWSAGYLKAADENGITSNLRGGKGKASTRGDVALMAYNGMSNILKAPSASDSGGEYSDALSVYLYSPSEGADIYYTTDGTTPTINSKKYKSAIDISETTTLKAVAVYNGIVSKNVMTEEYIIEKRYMLTVEDNSEGYVSVISEMYAEGSEIPISAPPKYGYQFKRWKSTGGGKFDDANSEYTVFTMPANDTTVRASFIKLDDSTSAQNDDSAQNVNSGSYAYYDQDTDTWVYYDSDTDTYTYESMAQTSSGGIRYYNEDPEVPTFDSVTGASRANGSNLKFSEWNYRMYYYKSTFEQKDEYEKYLLNNGWEIRSTSIVADDIRYRSTGTTYQKKDNPDEYFHLYLYDNCNGVGYDDGDVDILVYER